MNAKHVALATAAGLVAWRLFRSRTRYDLRGKISLVTGGSRGLGLELARQLASQGAIVAVCARRRDELQRAVDELACRGAKVVGRVADLSRPEDATETVDAIIHMFGRIDVVINNAGIIQVGPMETMNLGDFRTAMDNNFWSAVHIVEAAQSHLKETGGRIVNISSIGGKVAVPHLLPYCASKFALGGYSQGLRAELAKDGVSVTTVYPGLMRTGSHGQIFVKGNHEAEYTLFSIFGSMPLLTINSERAAGQIVDALERGDTEVVLTPAARWLAMANHLFPSLTSSVLALATRTLPFSEDETERLGFDSHSSLAPSVLTRLNESAAERNNEIPGAAPIAVE